MRRRRIFEPRLWGERIAAKKHVYCEKPVEGAVVPAQRPSWNYRKEEGADIILDMLCHWRYVLENLFGAVRRSPAWGLPTFRSVGTSKAIGISARQKIPEQTICENDFKAQWEL